MANEGKLQQARTKLLAAQHETSPKAQIALYKEASQLYIQAANEIQDVLGKQTMVYLAQSALSEGLRIKSFLTASTSTSSQQLRPKSTTSTLPTSQLPTNMTKHDDSVSEYCKRIVMNVHLERIKGLQKIPKEIEATPKDILKDLMQLEVQINNLGFKRTPSQMQKSIMASRHASSLGESFMILDESKSSTAPPPGSNQTSAGARRYSNDITQPSVGHSPPQKSRADVKLPVHVTSSPPNPQPELAVEPQQQQQQQLPSLNSLLQILPYIASFGMGTNGQGVPDKQQEAALANVMETIEWNEKSMFLSPQKRPWKKQESSSSTSPEANCDENASNESILRLLTTIATLRDENIKLEHENERVVQEMIRFREEYKLKFRELKKLVGDQPLSTIQESVVEESHASSSSAPPPKGKQLNPQEKIETASEKEERLLRRQNQLEQTVGGLLDKYYASQSELQRKDKHMEQISTSLKQLKQQQGIEVSELEQLIAQALAPPSSRKKHDDQKISKSGGGMQTSSGDSSLSKSSDSISRASPPSSPTDLSASTSAQSNSMLYSHARRQFMQHQLPRNRHPSTYTLESLQRANPTKPASK